jgi:hypothetical protein
MNEYYVVIKLVSGEQLMATLVNEDEYTIEIKNALQIKLRLHNEADRQFESISVVPFCQFTEDPNFVLDKSIIIYVKELSEHLVPRYEDLIESEFQVNLGSPTDVDDLVSKINKVAEKLKGDGVFVDNFEEEEELPPLFVNGTNTLQ